MNKLLILLGVAFLAGCATDTGALHMGPDSYLISRHAGSAFSGYSGLRSTAIKEANQYCTKHGKEALITKTIQYNSGGYPTADVYFRCIKPVPSKPKAAPSNDQTTI